MNKVHLELAKINLITPYIERESATLSIKRDKPPVVTTNFSDTEIKLGEADFFLKLIEQNAAHQAILFYGLSAFLAAGRSITLFLQAEGCKHKDFAEWYEGIQKQLQEDELSKFLKNSRDEALHARYSKIKTVFDIPLYKANKKWIHRPTEPIYAGFSFMDYVIENGLEKCRQFLERMKAIVAEAKERGFLPNENARNISLQATDVGKKRMFAPR